MITPQIQPTDTSAPTAVAVPVTMAALVAAADTVATPTAQQHASRWHFVLSLFEGLLHEATTPEVMTLLPAKYQGMIAAAAVVNQVAEQAANPAP